MRSLVPYAIVFLLIQLLLRLSLLVRGLLDIEFTALDVVLVMAKGLWLDVATAGWMLLPLALYYLLGIASRRVEWCLRIVFVYILLFDAVAEHLFWSEFTTRFNFIAVDYLLYTQEVIGNIVESYPLFPLLALIASLSLLITWVSMRLLPPALSMTSFKERQYQLLAMLLVCGGLHLVSDVSQADIPDNAEASEIAANGIYNLFHAFWHNEIHYERFYATEEDKIVAQNARNLLFEKDENITFVHDDGKDLTRLVKNSGAEKHKNVMLVVMESMSADYMGAFGNTQNITPNLDRLAQEGLFFTQLYATGTRTVRGLEAVTLSIPPTPGQSIIRRPHNENLFSLGFVMQDRGYDTKFIYGGYGYFDNMNNFFAGNGFDILDRNAMTKEETNFANVWGICDEDMFTRAIKEADISQAKSKPFLHLIMTTSNHRPYTYPEGRIDIPSHTNRVGGVKYADYAVGKFIADAKKKPWFKNTVFIFVADHTAGAGGKAELDPRKYHIPMIFYAPGMIKPQQFNAIVSQIDLAPTLLGLLNFSYYTKFYGEDLLHDKDEIPHAFISNFQKIALIKNDGLTVLSPKQKINQLAWPAANQEVTENRKLVDDAIAYYQSASWWKEQYQRIVTVVQ